MGKKLPHTPGPVTINDVFGRLTVIGRATGRSKWTCRCECGLIIDVWSQSLRRGATKSCGCYNRDAMQQRTVHGAARRGKQTPEYVTWRNIMLRCYYPSAISWKYYGGRGISVCDRWRESFENFLADMGTRPTSKHSIDRIDPNGNYEPGNCRWVTADVQSRNQRPRTKGKGVA